MKRMLFLVLAGAMLTGCAANTAPSPDATAMPRAVVCPEPAVRGIDYPPPAPTAGLTHPVKNPWTVGRDWPQDSAWQRLSEKDDALDPCIR